MRASRLLSIQLLLQLRGQLSAESLAESFEVSVRTIHRDIDQLSAAGIPVYAERGRNGGFRLMEGYRAKLTGLTPKEAGALAFAGAEKAASDLGLASDLSAAQLKLRASLTPGLGELADTTAARFYLDPAAWYADTESLAVLPALAEAVWGETRLRIDYESWTSRVARDIDPLGLVLKGGVWYLAAGVEGTLRSYRVSNILGAVAIPGRVRRPKNFDLAAWWQESARAFEARLFAHTARVRLSPEGLRLLRDISPRAARAARESHTILDRGWIEARIPVESPAMAARQLLHLGADIEILGPKPLRTAIARQARAVAALYRRVS